MAIVENDQILSLLHQPLAMNMSKDVLPLMEQEFERIHRDPSQIDKIYAVIGPGSFTGVRIGVTIAKTMAWALHKKVVALSSLEVLASGQKDSVIVPYIDAHHGYIFAGIYDESLNCQLKDGYYALEELMLQVGSQACFVGYTPLELVTNQVPQPDIMKVIHKHQQDASIFPHQLNPVYLKLTEAEEKRYHD